jgi:hypothetical protein
MAATNKQSIASPTIDSEKTAIGRRSTDPTNHAAIPEDKERVPPSSSPPAGDDAPPHVRTSDQVLKSMQADIHTGLSDARAKALLHEFGPNILKPPQRPSVGFASRPADLSTPQTNALRPPP